MPKINPLVFPELAAELARQNITLEELGGEVHRTASSLSQLLRGYLKPSADLRHRIAEALGRDEAELFVISDDVRRLVGQAVEQGHGAVVDDDTVLSTIAALSRRGPIVGVKP